jgi:hypothetical protein
MVEPWLRGTLGEVEPVRRAVHHALELAGEDAVRWCEGLGEAEMFARPLGLPPVAFQMRHMVRSLDRLLTYAEGGQLSKEQLVALRTEMDPWPESGGSEILYSKELGAREQRGVGGEGVWDEFRVGMERAMGRVGAIDPATFAEVRGVGRDRLAATVMGLLIHCAEHTQRHAGQMVTTAKVVLAMR